ncbi:alpha-galactosidase [Streptacidiphilus melanogenes]|uniref:alpha-galactosidase n=1 Tax=Streptacidiphilus melanogenes TaxID=411235 RepID=UPI0005A93942|nr:alpha-galactosidase [Streptacidiphilus melanogenes]
MPAALSHDATTGTWLLTTPSTSYALRVDGQGVPRHVHWGGPLTLADVASLPPAGAGPRSSFDGRPATSEELTVDGADRYGPPALRVRFADGTRALTWQADGHEQPAPGTLLLHFRDPHYPLRTTLGYRVHPDTDVIERWTELTHTGIASDPDDTPGDDILALRADSATLSLPPREDYRLGHAVGQWAAETQLRRTSLPYGETVLTSRTGTTSHRAQPWTILDAGDATEEHGQVWSAALAWSGSWQITLQRAPDNQLSLNLGAGHDAVTVTLRPGETHTTPPVLLLHVAEGGFGALSRAWHRHLRAQVLPHPQETRPVLYNSWEATGFGVTLDNQRQLASLAAGLGVELFVMDDGWFGARRDDHAGLGDWTPYPGAFPDGLRPLADEVHRLGMAFGLWVEPEMVNPDSDLYRAHPDWVLHFPHRPRTELRHQLVLNFARPDVAAWAFDRLTRLVADNDVDYLKWDMNRPFSEAGWPDEPSGRGDRLWFDHVRGYHTLVDRLRAAHPRLRIEACSGGGGRVDPAVLARTDQVWISDNTDAADRLVIQHGYAQLYPVRTMAAWVTDVPNQQTGRSIPLRFRFHSAMSGVLGIGGDLTRWRPQELKEAEQLVAEYKTVRHLVQHGELFRLRPPGDLQSLTAVQYLAPDAAEAAVFAWLPQPRFGLAPAPLRLAGLPRDAHYRDLRSGRVHSGAALRERGLDLDLPHEDWASTVVHLVRI